MKGIQPIQPGFGIRIKKLRYDQDMGQQELADLCELSIDQISNIECGKNFTREISLGLIADAFGVDAQALLDYSENDEFVKNGGMKWKASRHKDIPGIRKGKISITVPKSKRGDSK